MSTHTILTDQTVSITELRKNPAQYFREKPVAVLSNNKPAGYMVSAELFEQMMALLEEQESNREITGHFHPSADRLKTIAEQGNSLLLNATDKQLGDFSE